MPKAKDSGVEWLGEIPESWKILKGKFVLTLLNRPVLETDGVITCFRDGEVTLRSNRREEGFTFSTKEIGYQGIEKGDLVVHGMDGFAGAIGISDSRGKGSPILNVLDTPYNKRFIMYYLRGLAYRDVFVGLSTGIRVRSCDLRWNKLADLFFVIPPLSEQNKIASYLDKKSADIDNIISSERQQIDKLKEYKNALITKCVTKGLDPNVPLKDSGIDWMGPIPESWKISKIKNMYEVVLGKMLCDKPLDGTYTYENYICSQNIKYDGVSQTSIKKMWFNSKEKEQLFLCEGDVLISEGGNAGECCIYHNEFCPCYIQNAVHRVRGINDNLNKFLYYWLYALESLGYFQMICNKATIRHYTREKVLETPIVCLPINGQKDIVNYLDKKCFEIVSLISSKQQQIDKLNEYQKSLIYEYVTGKKEVN